MAFLLELLLLSAVHLTTTKADDIRLPPSITVGPNQIYIYRDGEKVSLPCQSLGYPSPTYTWEKNDAPLSMTGNIVRPDPTVGSIEIGKATKDDGGYYQCVATNTYGRTMSNKTRLQVAVLGVFDANAPKTNYTVRANDQLTLKCNAPESIPKAEYSWWYNTTSLTQTDVTLSPKVQIDTSNGDLVFASVDPNEPTNRLYRCNVYNYVMSRTNSGSYSRIIVSGSVICAAPLLQFSTPSPVTALRSQQTILRCFFSGTDSSGSIIYSWTYNGASGLPSGWTFVDGEARSPVSGTDPSNAGRYMCFGNNTIGQDSATIDLVVGAIPDFGSELENQPHDQNVTEGETVTIGCQATADPPATIVWSYNRTIFTRSNLPPRFELSDDLMTLTISDVCRDCEDGGTSLMNIECNASNSYGYSFAQGYLNVLLPTTITATEVTVPWSPHATYQFDFESTCDDSTPCLPPQWTFKGEPVEIDGDRLFIDDHGSLHINTANDTDAGSSRIGTYTCTVSNGYSMATMIATIEGDGLVSVGGIWWVGLLVILLVLLILLLVFLCWYCGFCGLCGPGGSYTIPPEKEEPEDDPKKEEDGFQELKPSPYVYLPIYTTPPSQPQPPPANGSFSTGAFYVKDQGNVYLPTLALPSSHLQSQTNGSFTTGAQAINTFHFEDQGNVNLPVYSVPLSQPRPQTNGNFITAATASNTFHFEDQGNVYLPNYAVPPSHLQLQTNGSFTTGAQAINTIYVEDQRNVNLPIYSVRLSQPQPQTNGNFVTTATSSNTFSVEDSGNVNLPIFVVPPSQPQPQTNGSSVTATTASNTFSVEDQGNVYLQNLAVPLSQPQSQTNGNFVTAATASNTFYVEDQGNVNLPNLAVPSSHLQPQTNGGFITGAQASNTFYVKDQGNVYLSNLALPPSHLQPQTNGSFTTGAQAINTFHFEDSGNVNLPISAVPLPHLQPTANGNFVTEARVINTFYEEDPGVVHLPNFAVPPSHLQPASPQNGAYYVERAGYQRRIVHTHSHENQGEVFSADVPNGWLQSDRFPQSEV